MRQVQNSEALAINELRKDALAIAEAGLAAIDISGAFRRTLTIGGDELRIGDTAYPLAGRRIYFVGVGKCAFAAARAVEELLGDRLAGGIALDVSPPEESSSNLELLTGTHPLPSEANAAATKRIIELLSGLGEDDLVLMLISGGGSALLCLPPASMTSADESTLWSELTAKGATIQELNTVRKHLSRARGGGLAFASYPAEVVSLIVSDVPGNDTAYTASGPTVLDASTVEDARAVLAQYGVDAANAEFIESPKEPRYFERVTNLLFLTNQDALAAMKDEAVRRGYTAEIVDDRFTGEAREVGRTVVEKLHGVGAKTALLYAGESTVSLSSSGLAPPKPAGEGGRNQEMALAALADIRDDELILPFASDGRDNTDHAGAIADTATRAHAEAHNLSSADYLDAHRSYDFFAATGDALTTGYTGTNVSDFIIAIKHTHE